MFTLKGLAMAVSMATTITLTACGGSSSSSSSPQPSPTPAPAPVPAPDPQITIPDSQLQAIIDGAVGGEVPGIVVHVVTPDDEFIGSAGVANLDSLESMTVDAKIPNGSAGKKATALLAIMLQEEGLYDLDDFISEYLPTEVIDRIQYGDQITIRQLLNHTAGVHDYLDQDTVEQWFEALIDDPDSIKTDAFALAISIDKPAYFVPGTGFQYSNSNYLLVGLVMDTVLGEHHSSAMRSRVIEPLGLNGTYFNGVENDRGDIVSGYFYFDDELVDTKPYYDNIGVADAPFVGPAEDVSTLLRAIVQDDSVVTDDMREEMFGEQSLIEFRNNQFYGLGMFVIPRGDITFYEHGGSEPGYQTFTTHASELDITVTVLFNCGEYDACTDVTGPLSDEIVLAVLP